MNILIIPSAKIINEELQSRYGKIVPILIPLENGIVLDKLYKEYENYYDEVIITLYEEAENTLKIINLKNYPKLKIKTLSKLDDIGNGIREVLKDLKNRENISNLSINFGDIYIENLNKYLNRNILCYSKNSEIDKWAYFIKENSNLIITQEKTKKVITNQRKDILIGFFNITLVEKFYNIILKKEKGKKDTLYQSLEEYNSYNRLECVLEDNWDDFGHLDNFLKAQKMVEARFFNEISIDKDKNILTKKSEEKEKLINEIKWFLTLPNKLQWITPRIYSYSLEWEQPKVSMEYYSYPTLHHLYLYGNHNIDKWKKIFKKLFYVHNEMKGYSLKINKEDIKRALNNIYINKTIERLTKVKQDRNFSRYFEEEFYINNIKIERLSKLKELVIKLVEKLEINKKKELNIIHGDYFFANMLYDPTADIIKLIDPRGDFGGYGIYGDPNYDLAKLAHSVDGKYDFIVEDLFELEELDKGFNYKIVYSKKYDEIKELFYSHFDKKVRLKIKFIQALLFLSMIPLHKDKPKRQKVMLGVGVRILNEVMEEIGVKEK